MTDGWSCYDTDGLRAREPRPSELSDEWLARFRIDALPRALDLAQAVAVQMATRADFPGTDVGDDHPDPTTDLRTDTSS
ncbi:hypothetical protein [Nocardia sp. IFM 10818]